MFDPLFYARLNALQNCQNQHANRANLEQLKANQSELTALRRQLAEEANKPQCPHCGGPSEQGFDRCKNCGQEILWYGQFVGKPDQRTELMQAYNAHQIAEQEEQQRRDRVEAENQKVRYERAVKNAAFVKKFFAVFIFIVVLGMPSVVYLFWHFFIR